MKSICICLLLALIIGIFAAGCEQFSARPAPEGQSIQNVEKAQPKQPQAPAEPEKEEPVKKSG